ncbi:hypothetical protein [Cyanobium gracile]|uniref:Putative integral membrane protein n=1 Tax=Cyanobium gracile (strain ATCC 27147 / PCC 6307) TaxID=292564 RepID=K9PB38_CYAGP|nr:hypothetical protein [Cyanobium gracile]AFY29946.1 putative integral membrane protein [Cyanobium gracile PCC 6307]
MSTPGGRQGPRLNFGDALQEGWRAFSRSPGPFVGFPLLVVALQFLIQPLQSRISSGGVASSDPVDWVLYLIGLTANLLLNLWCAIGLVRGAGSALQGGHPSLGQLMRWDGEAFLRLLRAWLVLVAMVAVPLLGLLLLVGGPLALLSLYADQLVPFSRTLVEVLGLSLAVVFALLLGVVLLGVIYLAINQSFLTQIVLFERAGSRTAVQRGRALVDPSWLMVLLLTLIESLLVLLGLLACLVGGFVAWPLVVCIATAAYRQLVLAGGGTDPLPPLPGR